MRTGKYHECSTTSLRKSLFPGAPKMLTIKKKKKKALEESAGYLISEASVTQQDDERHQRTRPRHGRHRGC